MRVWLWAHRTLDGTRPSTPLLRAPATKGAGALAGVSEEGMWACGIRLRLHVREGRPKRRMPYLLEKTKASAVRYTPVEGRCTCGLCSSCKTRAYKTAWAREKRGKGEREYAQHAYTCTCGRANENGTCKACSTQWKRTGSTERRQGRLAQPQKGRQPTVVFFNAPLFSLRARVAELERAWFAHGLIYY